MRPRTGSSWATLVAAPSTEVIVVDLSKWDEPSAEPDDEEPYPVGPDVPPALVGPELAYVPQMNIRVIDDDPQALQALQLMKFLIHFGDEVEEAVADDRPLKPKLQAKGEELAAGLSEGWLDTVADGATGETLSLGMGMTALFDWVVKHLRGGELDGA